MYCPACGNLLQKLSVATDSGGKFEVDHCGRCGGTWFDPYEINRVPYHEIVRLARLTVLPKEKPETLKDHRCPRCFTKLAKFQGESVAKGISLLRCSKCRGIFAAQEALEEFKKHQEETISELKERKTTFPSLSVVFVPALFVALLFVSTFITIASLQKKEVEMLPLELLEEEKTITAEEQIKKLQTFPLSPAAESITFQTKIPLKSYVSYGISPLKLSKRTISEKPTFLHHLIVTNLKPGIPYVFQITLVDEKGREFKTEKKWFRTKP